MSETIMEFQARADRHFSEKLKVNQEKTRAMKDSRCVNYRTKLQKSCAMAGCLRCRDESPGRRDEKYTVALSMLEMEVVREWLAHGCTDPESLEGDIETAESVIAKLKALGARGTL